jgi:hypothetical protein
MNAFRWSFVATDTCIRAAKHSMISLSGRKRTKPRRKAKNAALRSAARHRSGMETGWKPDEIFFTCRQIAHPMASEAKIFAHAPPRAGTQPGDAPRLAVSVKSGEYRRKVLWIGGDEALPAGWQQKCIDTGRYEYINSYIRPEQRRSVQNKN